ncbi:MAG: hypothetical protein HXS54_05865 [Theionarchaea archaeon]|nr:hypothetical protein [Theionarchaea archaeon]DBA34894.1 TPA_asm: hypothetical protein vir521_00100 [Caudoviricetes sp. vir521]
MDDRANIKVDRVTRDVIKGIIDDWQRNGIVNQNGEHVSVIGDITFDAALRQIIKNSTVVSEFHKKRLHSKMFKTPPLVNVKGSKKGSMLGKKGG